jgi:hypothetical protein
MPSSNESASRCMELHGEQATGCLTAAALPQDHGAQRLIFAMRYRGPVFRRLASRRPWASLIHETFSFTWDY